MYILLTSFPRHQIVTLELTTCICPYVRWQTDYAFRGIEFDRSEYVGVFISRTPEQTIKHLREIGYLEKDSSMAEVKELAGDSDAGTARETRSCFRTWFISQIPHRCLPEASETHVRRIDFDSDDCVSDFVCVTDRDYGRGLCCFAFSFCNGSGPFARVIPWSFSLSGFRAGVVVLRMNPQWMVT